MQVRKHGWLFKIGHMFVPYAQLPERVNRCTLVWRFGIYLIPWILCSLVAWIAFGLVLGIGGHMVRWPWHFLAEARYLSFKGGNPPRWIPAQRALERLCILSYEKEDIQWLEWMVRLMNNDQPRPRVYDGRMRSPFMFVIGGIVILAIVAAALYGFFYALPVYALPWAWRHGIVPAYTATANTVGWWGWTIAALLCLLIARRVWQSVAKTETGAVLISHFKEWKREHCPIYEVV